MFSFALFHGDGCQVNPSKHKSLVVTGGNRTHVMCKEAKEEAVSLVDNVIHAKGASRLDPALWGWSFAGKRCPLRQPAVRDGAYQRGGTTSPRNHQLISPRGGFFSESEHHRREQLSLNKLQMSGGLLMPIIYGQCPVTPSCLHPKKGR